MQLRSARHIVCGPHSGPARALVVLEVAQQLADVPLETADAGHLTQGLALRPAAQRHELAPASWRIIGLIDGATLEAVLRRHAVSQHAALGGGPGEVVAHDGKSLRGSYDTAGDTNMSQFLRAFAGGTRIILGHVAIMVKSNEIPAMQALVRELGLAEVLCTADAMHCQIKTIEAVKASGGEALLQVKGNQSGLEAAFEALPVEHEPEDCHVETGKLRRNRQETRRVEVFKAGRLLDLLDWQTHAIEAVRVTRTVLHKDVATGWKWQPTRNVAWYASTQNDRPLRPVLPHPRARQRAGGKALPAWPRAGGGGHVRRDGCCG